MKKLKKKKKDKGQSFSELFYGDFLSGIRYIKESKKYIWFATLVFIFVSIFGFIYPYLFEEQILSMIEELVFKTEGLTGFGLVSFIFTNNLKSSFFAMILGVLLGIVPLFVILINAYVLGFVVNKTVAIAGLGVLWRLLPHGIFEIPAVLISIGLGLKIGAFWTKTRDKSRSIVAIFVGLAIFTISSLILTLLILGLTSLSDPALLQEPDYINIIFANPVISAMTLILFLISFFVSTLILSKDDKEDFYSMMKKSTMAFVLVIIPLLIIAAIIEGALIYLLE